MSGETAAHRWSSLSTPSESSSASGLRRARSASVRVQRADRLRQLARLAAHCWAVEHTVGEQRCQFVLLGHQRSAAGTQLSGVHIITLAGGQNLVQLLGVTQVGQHRVLNQCIQLHVGARQVRLDSEHRYRDSPRLL